MLHDWVSETTTTTGTGTITLAGASSADLMSISESSIADGALVDYQIKSGDNREKGRGIYTASGTTLARTTVLATWIASTNTYDNTSPSAISLTGTSDVFISATSPAVLGHGVPFTITSSSEDVPDNVDNYEDTTTHTAVDTLIMWGAFFAYQRVVTSLGISITTADAGSTDARAGIWAQASDGSPGQLLASTGDLVVTSTGHKFGSILETEVTIEPGPYWIGFKADSNTLQYRHRSWVDVNSVIGGVDTGNSSRATALTATSISGALASDPTVSTAFNAVFPGVMLR